MRSTSALGQPPLNLDPLRAVLQWPGLSFEALRLNGIDQLLRGHLRQIGGLTQVRAGDSSTPSELNDVGFIIVCHDRT
jgi:hypothetical protein